MLSPSINTASFRSFSIAKMIYDGTSIPPVTFNLFPSVVPPWVCVRFGLIATGLPGKFPLRRFFGIVVQQRKWMALNYRYLFADESLDIPDISFLLGIAKTEGSAVGSRSPCSADPVDISF